MSMTQVAFLRKADMPTKKEDCDWIKPNLTDQDVAISFIWEADFAAAV